MRLPRILGVVASLLGVGQAQEDIRAGLRSDDEVQLLWAAWRATGQRLPALAPDVEQAMARLAARPRSEHRARLAESLGVALLQTGAQVSAATLRVWWEQLPAAREALVVLAATRPRDHVELLRALAADIEPSITWVCACNALLEAEPAWLGRQLLPAFTLDLELRATDGGTEPDPTYGLLEGVVNCGRESVPAGLPPISQCRLTPGDGASGPVRLVARGPLLVRWTHRVRSDGSSSCHYTAPVVGCRAYALACLHQMAGAPDCPDFADTIRYPDLRDAAIRCDIPWRDAVAWERECQERLGALREQWARVLVGLCGKGLLPVKALTEPDILCIRILDGRADKTTPLPRIE